MSRCEQSNSCPAVAAPAKSPLKLAIFISCAIAAGAIGSTFDTSIFDDIASGKWLTGAFEAAQQRNTAAVAALETKVDAIAKDIDFVAARVSTSVRRNEDQAYDRFAALDAEIAALKQKIAGVEAVRVAPSRAADMLLGAAEKNPADTNEMVGLRSSLHDLAVSHHGAVAAITKRLDRLEVMVGLSTDVMSSVADPLTRQRARRKAVAEKPNKKPAATPPAPQIETTADRSGTRPERGHLFNVKPISQQSAPLRMSRLPD